jgi:hypothetical protein
MQVENWHITLAIAFITTLVVIASKNITFYNELTKNLFKLVMLLTAFTSGYFIRGNTELDTAMYLITLTAIPISLFLFSFIAYVVTGIKEQRD